MLSRQQMDEIILKALDEDMNYGDITTEVLFKEAVAAHGRLIAKEKGVLAGIVLFARVFELLDDEIEIIFHKKDSDPVEKGDLLAEIKGDARSILKGERTALNLLQHMSGIATMTSELVAAAAGTAARIVDTRKTLPGLRNLEKYAVRMGGGFNHRYNLSDAVMIKDNHIRAVGSISEAVRRARKAIPHTMRIEVETENHEEVIEAIEAGADIIMLDNMDCAMMAREVDYINHRALTEASGNITVMTVGDVARTGVDVISCGAITHSVKALDISLKF